MAISAGAAILGGAAIGGISNILGAEAQEDSAYAATQVTREQIAEQRRQFDQQTKQWQMAWDALQPYREAGTSSINILRRELGIDPGGTQFQETPDYIFARDQGENALLRAQAARGNPLGGRAYKEAVRYGEGVATGYRENYLNRLNTLAGFGPGASNIGQVGPGPTSGYNARTTGAVDGGNHIFRCGTVQL